MGLKDSLKFKKAIELKPELKDKPIRDVYINLENTGLEWDKRTSSWIKKEDIDSITITISTKKDLMDDVVELIENIFKEYGLEILKTSRAYPKKEYGENGKNETESKTEAIVYMTLELPEE